MEGQNAGHTFITGKRRYDLWLFAAILFCMLLAGYRLRVYYRSDPVPSPSPQAWYRVPKEPWQG